MLLIVPPTTYVDFEYGYDHTDSKLLAWIRKLRLTAEPTNASGKELMELCDLITSAKLSTPYHQWKPVWSPQGESGSAANKEVCMVQEMILSTLQCEDYELYDDVVAAARTMTEKIFQELGKHLCLSEDRMPFEKR